MPQERISNVMVSNKTQNYHIRDIIYNLYKYNILKKKEEIKFISITTLSFIKDIEKFGHCMELIGAEVNPYHITSLKKQLDKAELKKLSWHWWAVHHSYPWATEYKNRYKDKAKEQLYGPCR